MVERILDLTLPFGKENSMKFCALAAVILVVLAVLAGCGEPDDPVTEAIKNGSSYLERGDLEKARIHFRKAMRAKPVAPEPYYMMGLLDEDEGLMRNALANFRMAEAQRKRFYPASLKIAQYDLMSGRDDEARKRVDAVLTAQPKNVEAHAVMSALLVRGGQVDKAEKEALLALGADAANISARLALVDIFEARNDLGNAIKVLDDGVSLRSKNLALALRRAELFGKAGDFRKMIEAYWDIFELRPSEMKYRDDLVSILIDAGKLDEAEAVLRRYVVELPGNWGVRHSFASFLFRYRGLNIAEAEIRKWMKEYPYNDEPYFWLAEVYGKANAVDQAVALLNEVFLRGEYETMQAKTSTLLESLVNASADKAYPDRVVDVLIEKHPTAREFLLFRVNALMAKGAYKRALSAATEILHREPGDIDAKIAVAEALFREGKTGVALDMLRKISNTNHSNHEAWVRWVLLSRISDTQKRTQALQSINKERAPENADPETYARYYIRAGQWDKAKASVREFEKNGGRRLTTAFLEGRILDGQGRTEDALRKFREVLRLDPALIPTDRDMQDIVDTYFRLGRLNDSMRYLEAVSNPSPMVLHKLGDCYSALGKVNDSVAVYDRAIAADPSFADPYIARAELMKKSNDKDGALEMLIKASSAAPGDYRAPLAVAEALVEKNDFLEAIVFYEEAIKRNPRLDAVAYNVAELISDYRFEDAAALERALTAAQRFSDSDNPYALDALAWVYYRQGKHALALPLLERAFSINRELPAQVRYHYGAVLMKNGHGDRAKDALRAALDGAPGFRGVEEARWLLEGK